MAKSGRNSGITHLAGRLSGVKSAEMMDLLLLYSFTLTVVYCYRNIKLQLYIENGCLGSAAVLGLAIYGRLDMVSKQRLAI